MKRKFIIELTLILSMFSGMVVIAKPFNLGNGDHGRAKMAERYFLSKNYDKATPLFAQLVSNHPNNYKYNYYYGVCLLITNKDKDKAVKYLESAVMKPKTPDEIFYYLGKAYHLNYMFDEGIRAITEFNNIIKPKQRMKWNSEEPLEWCYNAKRILDHSKDSIITEKTEVPATDFYSKYVFTGNRGKMLAMPEKYLTKDMDEQNPTVFLSANNKVMYYSAYNKETSSRDIFRVDKQQDESWGTPYALDANVNSKQDEMYPTCSPDGKVLFFSSLGHLSTGGFDLYKSVFSMADKKWSPAENMASPYSSPFDDFCFVPSVDDKVAYFTSSRESDYNNLLVCKVAFDGKQIPIELKGVFACIGQPDLKGVHININRTQNDSAIAALNTDPKSGAYNVMLPGPGTYTFKIEAEGFKPAQQTVTFSEFGETYFVQEIFLSRNVDGTEDLAINNLKAGDNWDTDMTAKADSNSFNTITMADIGATGKNLSDKELEALNDAINKSNTPSSNTLGIAATNGLEYRIQIGAFKKQTADITEKNLSHRTKEVFYGQKDTDWHRYFIGHIGSMKQARELAKIVRKAGFKDAYVVAFKEGNNIPLLQAISEEGN